MATICAIAAIVYAAADVVHELIGHGGTAMLLGRHFVRVSTVAFQSQGGASRLVAANGTLANVVSGAAALVALRARRQLTRGAYALWLFAIISLCEVFYAAFSAVTNIGDWTVVIQGFRPASVWRAAMFLIAAAIYVVVIRWGAAELSRLMAGTRISRSGMRRLVYPAYLSGGIVSVAASLWNPIGSASILVSGAGASFGLTWGLLRIPALVKPTPDMPPAASIGFSRSWIAAGVIAAVLFIAVLGPGIPRP